MVVENYFMQVHKMHTFLAQPCVPRRPGYARRAHPWRQPGQSGVVAIALPAADGMLLC